MSRLPTSSRAPMAAREEGSDPFAGIPVPRGLFASLSLRNYRLYFFGALLSNIGLWMFRVAQDWLVLTILTDYSSVALGTITGLQFLPILLLSAYAGGIADRFDRRKLMMVTQTLLGLVALVQAALVITGTVQLWQVYVLATLSGVATAFDSPARQAFVSEMVPDTYLVNAVGLNSTTFNASRLVGPGIAGLTIGAWGVGPAILFNALSYAATVLALASMDPARLRPAPRSRGKGSVRAGLAYVSERPDILLVMFMVFMLGTFGLNFQVTNALMATQVFGVGPEEYGLMGTVMGLGTLAAALMAANRTRPRISTLVAALAGFAAAMVGLALSPSYLLYIALLAVVGMCSLTVTTSANATVQLSTDPQMRGRVMSLYMLVFMGGTPIGAPLIGWVGAVFGARATLLVGAMATGAAVLVALIVLVRARRKGEADREEPAGQWRAVWWDDGPMNPTLHLVDDEAADALLSESPFALVLGMQLDQQVPMEVAFSGPAKLRERMGDLDPARIATMDPEEFLAVFAEKPAVHRFPRSMAARVQALAAEVTETYGGDAARIWTDGEPTGAEVLKRLMALPGFGEQKAKILLALLGKQCGLTAPGWREAAGDYGAEGSRRSIADVVDRASLLEVRAVKQEMKAAAKAKPRTAPKSRG